MALSWLTALKAVPWSEVVQAAPSIVQGARKLYSAARGYAAQAEQAAVPGEGSSAARLRVLEAKIAELEAEQRSSAELIRSLAEQQVAVIAALEGLRKRVAILFGLCAALAVAVAALWIALSVGR